MTGVARTRHQSSTGGVSPSELTRLAAQSAAAQSLSRHLQVIADGLEAAAVGLPTPLAQAVPGPAAGAISEMLSTQPDEFRRVASACRRAATAYSRFAELLEPAIHELRRALSSPSDLAEVLSRDAAQRAHEAARLTATTLSGLAAVAPQRPPRWRRWLAAAEDARAEVLLGAQEATEESLVAAIGFTRWVARHDPSTTVRLLGTVKEAASHPADTGRAVVDWHTWRSNPARATGHLLPSVAGGFGAGTSTATGRAGQLSRAARMSQLARAEEAGRRGATEAAARSARSRLIDRSTQPLGPMSWEHTLGRELTPQAVEAVERFSALIAAGEPSLTKTMREVSRAARADLAGLSNRLKTGESMRRKVATQQANTGRPLPVLLDRAEDAVRYTVVLENRSYVSGVEQVTRLLAHRGYHNLSLNNAWSSQRYRGLNTTWADPSTGIAFEVQFHTPASWRVTRDTHRLYEEFRDVATTPERRAELSERIGAAYRTAPVPEGVEYLSRPALPPSAVVERAPVDYTVHAGAGGALGPALPRAGESGEGR
ncbi:hypothetical protein Kisp02_45670 [Kineosporia sp. NBRC 101731]|nr:hypothetical protein Kisp02_45670 [Kineosporia sp. NBRC 101731]